MDKYKINVQNQFLFKPVVAVEDIMGTTVFSNSSKKQQQKTLIYYLKITLTRKWVRPIGRTV